MPLVRDDDDIKDDDDDDDEGKHDVIMEMHVDRRQLKTPVTEHPICIKNTLFGSITSQKVHVTCHWHRCSMGDPPLGTTHKPALLTRH